MGAGGGMRLFAVTAPGLAGITARELRELGSQPEVDPAGAGAAWNGAAGDLYRANLHLRTASRVLVRIAEFRARSFIELERHVKRIDFSPFLGAQSRVQLRVSSRKSKLYHERAIAERFGRMIGEATGAVVEAGRGDDEDADGEGAEEGERRQLFVVRFDRDLCTVSADSSGELLHRRGYRQALAKAPLRETLAAAMLLGTGWRGDTALVDPLCGAGTIPIEGALIARRIPPGLASASRRPRDFAFLRWPSFDGSVWEETVAEGRAKMREAAAVQIVGSDRDPGAIEASEANAARAGVAGDIDFRVLPLSRIPAPADTGAALVTNPPYGVRVGETRPLRNLYATLGKVARERFAGGSVSLLTTGEGLERQLGIELTEVLRTRNGGLPIRLFTGNV